MSLTLITTDVLSFMPNSARLFTWYGICSVFVSVPPKMRSSGRISEPETNIFSYRGEFLKKRISLQYTSWVWCVNKVTLWYNQEHQRLSLLNVSYKNFTQSLQRLMRWNFSYVDYLITICCCCKFWISIFSSFSIIKSSKTYILFCEVFFPISAAPAVITLHYTIFVKLT
jgi:hypothetical protein